MTVTSGFDLQRVQKIRKWAAGLCLAGAVGLALVTATPLDERLFHNAIEAFGLGAMIVAIVGRAWCSLYIGGRKKAEIVQRGPYSLSRNPLYLFSYIGAFGMGAQTGSVTMATLFMVIAFVVFHFTIAREEAWLTNAFGAPYVAYMQQTPRYGPDFSRWLDEDTLQVRPQFFLTTLRDGLVMLLAIPIFEAIEKLQAMGTLSVLLHLP